MSSTFLYPNVTSLPGQSGVQPADRGTRGPANQPAPGEFDEVFKKTIGPETTKPDLEQVKSPLKFSSHASQRLQDRKIAIDPATMARVNDAIDKAASKGVEDTLVLTSNAALIVNVPNRTVITAMDRNQLTGNVFTNIDGAVIV